MRMTEPELRQSLSVFLIRYETTEARTLALRGALESPMGTALRRQLGEWVVRLAPVERMVPESYEAWRPLVRDAMIFVVTRLSAARLAPKMVEQIELPPDTTPETRLLRLISRVPGLQKIGQVLARNRRLPVALRDALSQLENGISDVTPDEIREAILERLGERIGNYQVRIDPEIYSEASVSAVVRFTWRNPHTRRRERGVFKVLKPYVPQCYAEDMRILQRLGGYLARKHRGGGIPVAGLEETLTEIRLLLEREVDFRREQHTLRDALNVYRSAPGVRIPHPIGELCTDTITALTHESGVKVTEATLRPSAARTRVAERLAEALIAIPTFSLDRDSIFHADPHAGNVLYDTRRREIVLLDWALTDRLSRRQRGAVLMLVLMALLRDVDGVCRAIERLCQGPDCRKARSPAIRRTVTNFLDNLPLLRAAGAMDAMRLLEAIALQGLRFPSSLLMFRKASFTLEGVLADVAGSGVRIDSVIGRYALTHWVATGATLWSLLSASDWLALQWSALTFASRLCVRALAQPWRRLAQQPAVS